MVYNIVSQTMGRDAMEGREMTSGGSRKKNLSLDLFNTLATDLNGFSLFFT